MSEPYKEERSQLIKYATDAIQVGFITSACISLHLNVTMNDARSNTASISTEIHMSAYTLMTVPIGLLLTLNAGTVINY